MTARVELAPIVVLLCCAVAIRWWCFSTGRSDFDGDEAITSLMAKDIWLGRDYPVFFSGQTYGGSLESYLTAPFFAARGRADVVGVRLAGVLSMAMGFALFHAFVRWSAGRRAALAALAVVTFSPGFFAIWSVKQRGGYLLLPMLSVAILWLSLAIDERARDRSRRVAPLAACLGLVIGLGWWTHRSVVFAIAAVVVALVWRLAARALAGGGWTGGKRLIGAWIAGALGCLAGYSPVLWFMARGGSTRTPFELGTLAEIRDNILLMARSIVPRLAGVEDLLVVGEGEPAPVAAWVGAVAAGVCVVAGLASAVHWSIRRRHDRPRLFRFVALMSLWALAALAGQAASRFTQFVGNEPRQILTVFYALAGLCAAGWIGLGRRWPWAPAIAVGLVAIHGLTSTIALAPEPLGQGGVPVRYAGLMEALTRRGAKACYFMDNGYARGYWTAMELYFHADERIAFVPPEHTNRLPRLAEVARREQRPAIWVTRFPLDLVENYSHHFETPLAIEDIGAFRIATSDEVERMDDVVYRLTQEPWQREGSR